MSLLSFSYLNLWEKQQLQFTAPPQVPFANPTRILYRRNMTSQLFRKILPL